MLTKADWNLGEEVVNMYLGHGGEFFKPGTAEASVNNAKGVATLEMLKSLMEYSNPDFLTYNTGAVVPLWESGELAMAEIWGSSMGSLLAQAGAQGKRFLLPKSRTMIHQPSGGARGMASDIEIQYKEIERMKKDLTEIYVLHNSKGKTYEDFEAGMDRDNFLTAQEALDWGLADEIIVKRDDNENQKDTT